MDFDQFLATVDRDRLFSEMIDAVDSSRQQFESSGCSEQNLTQASTIAGLLVGMEYLLRAYHEWFASQYTPRAHFPEN